MCNENEVLNQVIEIESNTLEFKLLINSHTSQIRSFYAALFGFALSSPSHFFVLSIFIVFLIIF